MTVRGARTLPKLPAVHPGEVLLEDFLRSLRLSQCRLARGLSVPPRRINEIVRGRRVITADTALRLARFFGTSERFWLNLQTRHDLEMERDREEPPSAEAVDEEPMDCHPGRSADASLPNGHEPVRGVKDP